MFILHIFKISKTLEQAHTCSLLALEVPFQQLQNVPQKQESQNFSFLTKMITLTA
jgi:hypothetical protein